jgi:hypothetical protein
VAVVQIRNPKSEGRAYYERKRTEGKTSKEALRCLKRRLSDVIYRQLVADYYAKLVPSASVTTARPTPSTSSSPMRRSRPGGPPSGPRCPSVEAFIALDWKDDRLVGIEVLDADVILPRQAPRGS